MQLEVRAKFDEEMAGEKRKVSFSSQVCGPLVDVLYCEQLEQQRKQLMEDHEREIAVVKKVNHTQHIATYIVIDITTTPPPNPRNSQIE